MSKLAFWLEIKKEHLKDLLVSNFNEDEDYIIEKNKPNGKGIGIGKNNTKVVMLTYTCAKMLCMISRTPKANIIRKFYIDLEKLINNYKNYIIEGLQNTIDILENNQKEIPNLDKIKGTVYILQSPKDIDGLYRFGQSDDFTPLHI